MLCLSWTAVEFSHDAVKNRELDMQLEIAKAMAKFSKPSLSIEPGSEPPSPGFGAPGKDKL
jgi:hypothetical protein